MKQKYKKLGIIVAIVLIILVVLTFVANMIIERKIKTALDNLPESVELTYDHVNANVWSGTVELVLPTITITGETTSKTILNAKLKTIKVIDLSYWDFIFNDKVSVETLEIDSLIAKYLHNPLVKNDDYN